MKLVHNNDEYHSCLKLNEDEAFWLKKVNNYVRNLNELVLHPMKSYSPQCRLDCPYAKRCKEIWEN